MATSRLRPTLGRCGGRRRIVLLLISGLIFPAAEAPPALAQVSPPARGASVHPYAMDIAEASQRFDIPEAWIVAVMQGESAGDAPAVSRAGAMGLMQVMPDTWAELRARYALGRDPFAPRDNVLAGTAYLREMWDRYGDIDAMLAAYNAGPLRFDEHRATGRPLPAETRAYVVSLAPALRGERPSKGVPMPTRPLDWREAVLFVTPAIGASTANPASDNARSLLPATSNTLIAPQPQGLFVATRDARGRP